MKFKILILSLFIYQSHLANDKEYVWGQTGHRVIGEIASQHLTKKAKRNLRRSLVKKG